MSTSETAVNCLEDRRGAYPETPSQSYYRLNKKAAAREALIVAVIKVPMLTMLVASPFVLFLRERSQANYPSGMAGYRLGVGA
jgi:hypothetical protein